MSEPLIRTATPEDVAAMHALMYELAEFEKLTHLFVATVEGVQDALFGENFSTFLGKRGLYLEDLYIQPTQRGTGLGTKMLKHLAALAVERECGRFEWSVLDWNQNAIDFYEKMGATVLPDWRIVRITGDALGELALSK